MKKLVLWVQDPDPSCFLYHTDLRRPSQEVLEHAWSTDD